MIKTNNFILILTLIIPFTLILGPALPDIIITLIGISFIILNFRNLKDVFEKYKIYTIFFFLFWLYLLFNTLISFDPHLSLERSLPFVRFYFFSLAFNEILNDPKKFNYIIASCFITIFFVIFDLIYQFIFLEDIFRFKPQHSNTRFQGPFNEEFIAGSFLIKFSLIPMGLLFMKKNYYRYWFAAVLILAILITGERMALIISVLAYIFFSFLYDFRKSSIISFVIFIFLSFVVSQNQESIGYRLNDFLERVGYNYLIGKSNRSFFDYGHGAHFLTSLEIFKDNPIFGSGLKTFREICSDSAYENIPSYEASTRCTTHPHNYYLEILSELGIVGLMLFLFPLVVLGKKLIPISKFNILKVSFFAILIFLFPIAATNSLFTNWTTIVFFYILCFNSLRNK